MVRCKTIYIHLWTNSPILRWPSFWDFLSATFCSKTGSKTRCVPTGGLQMTSHLICYYISLINEGQWWWIGYWWLLQHSIGVRSNKSEDSRPHLKHHPSSSQATVEEMWRTNTTEPPTEFVVAKYAKIVHSTYLYNIYIYIYIYIILYI